MGASWIFNKQHTYLEVKDFVTALLIDIIATPAASMRNKIARGLVRSLLSKRSFKASDPRDKVYGLLNLVSPRRKVEALSVNYSKTVGQVYADTALTDIRLHSRLFSLAHIDHPRDFDGHEELRSWAPQWNGRIYTSALFEERDKCPWRPANPHVPKLSIAFNTRPEELCLRGLVYQNVRGIENIMYRARFLTRARGPANIGTGAISVAAPMLRILEAISLKASFKILKEQSTKCLSRTVTGGVCPWSVIGSEGLNVYVQDLDINTTETYYRLVVNWTCGVAQSSNLRIEG
jgi:hypothetical protein